MSSKLADALYRYVPAIDSLRTYNVASFRRDALAGLTVAAVAVPQAMAYALIFHMPPQMGLFTAIVMTAVGALLDSSKQLINGPTNAISIAMLSALTMAFGDFEALSPDKQLQWQQSAIMMALFIGAIQTGIALFRFGDLSRFISHSVIIGFTIGASILLLLDQLKSILGLKAVGDVHDHFLFKFYRTMTEGGSLHWPTFGIAALTIAIALLARYLNRKFRLGLPELLIALASAGAVLAILDPAKASGIRLLGEVPRELPSFEMPTIDWGLIRLLSNSALAIAFLGLLEAMAMAKSIAGKTGQKLDMNQQCLSEGVANMAGSFFQCFPGSGSLTRSYINHVTGAATQWSGVISAVGVTATILLFAPLAQYVPRASLAGILILTAFRMVDPKQVAYHFKATRYDASILVATAFSAVFISIEFCILVGVLLSFAFYVPRAAKIKVNELTITNERVIREAIPSDLRCSYIRILNIEGELFFGCAPELERQLKEFEETLPDSLKLIVLRMRRANNPDAVCIHVMEAFVRRMKDRTVTVMFSGVHASMARTMQNVGLDQVVGAENIFREETEVWASTFTAMKKAYATIGLSRCQHCPNREIAKEERNDWSYMI
jgi:SulP family sulfate permease